MYQYDAIVQQRGVALTKKSGGKASLQATTFLFPIVEYLGKGFEPSAAAVYG
jgi:hypothetical protein